MIYCEKTHKNFAIKSEKLAMEKKFAVQLRNESEERKEPTHLHIGVIHERGKWNWIVAMATLPWLPDWQFRIGWSIELRR